MTKKTFNNFNRGLSWEIRIYTLLTIAVTGFAFITDAWAGNWVIAILLGIAVILFAEAFTLFSNRYPGIRKTIRWILLMILVALFLIGMKT